MNTLLLEIGTEEIPAGYIVPALEALSATLSKKLTEARIEHGRSHVFGTPRRLTVKVEDLASKQQSVKSEVIGPPAKMGFDENGKPTMAAQKFAEKVGVPLGKLTVKDTPKGAYLSAEKSERGLATLTLLKEILPRVILATPFPKKMRWADLDIEFARPIHSILALLGNSVVAFNLGNLKSSRYTCGHSFMAPAKIKLNSPDEYLEKLRAAHVVADMQERKKILEERINAVAKGLGGSILPDDELVDINNNLVEYPIAVAGKFDTEFLEVPDEVLINAMREHQKYFAVVDRNHNLMPCFIAVNNTAARDLALSATGHQRVIRARLADAQFFYQGDLEVTNDERVEKLKRVLFQAELGTVSEKCERVANIAEALAASTPNGDDLITQVRRAARLSKSDLVSQVVGEFPKLQGIMGRIYAGLAGEPVEVAAAIEEHYRPVYSGAPLPETLVGAILSIADKMDSICGCFSVGLIPTGASDPYALRRQGIGIVQILNDKGLSFPLQELIRSSLEQFGNKNASEITGLVEKVYTFIKNRISHLLAEEGFSKDVIAAIVSVSVDDVPHVRNRVAALESLKARPDFEPLAVGFKRVVNIIKKSGQQEEGAAPQTVEPKLFEHESEGALFEEFKAVDQKVADAMENESFDRALVEIASLRDAVDRFFDGVMVMAEDTGIRRNRLALLGQIAALFGKFA
ncbi:MAG: glycine--tRNA ligase subunit beta, partial [Desulfobacteraceae bacterium]|nr:glycine--tRNA ligase subunit beta [Desulfobacteraceae bacterium]